MSESEQKVQTGEDAAACESPPAAPNPARETVADPRVRLLQLAAELMRRQDRRLVSEFLRLRRAV
jgi:hypothetical protein